MNLSYRVQISLDNNIYGEDSTPIYGSAYFLSNKIDNNGYNFNDICQCLYQTIKINNTFHNGIKPSEVIKNFCHLICVDPMLIEAYLCTRISKFDYKE